MNKYLIISGFVLLALLYSFQETQPYEDLKLNKGPPAPVFEYQSSTAKYKLALNFTITQTKHPAFVSVFQDNNRQELWVSQFTGNPLQQGYVQTYSNIGQPNKMGFIQYNQSFVWPNIMSMYNAKQLGFSRQSEQNVVLFGDGFLVPGKNTGGVQVILQPLNKSSATLELTTPKNGWFYHMVGFEDMNQDGRVDIITARANLPLITKKGKGELLWLEQPSSNQTTNKWTEYVINTLCEVAFVYRISPQNKSHLEIYCANFFQQNVAVTLFDLSQGKQIFSRIIDNSSGPAESIEFADFKLNGSPDLLISVHDNVKGVGGPILAYEIPSDIQNGTFVKHIIANGSLFNVTEKGPNQAAPGFTYAIYPDQTLVNKTRPSIISAGDGSQRVHYFEPQGTDPYNYTETQVIFFDGVVGALAFGNVIGSPQYLDVYAPNYDKGGIFLFEFQPNN